MDIVFPIRASGRTDELRYSLRSLVNLPHDRVWIAGHRPEWVSKEVGHIAVHQLGGTTKYERSLANLLAACSHPEVSDEFVRFDDDFFVMVPMDRVPLLHQG